MRKKFIEEDIKFLKDEAKIGPDELRVIRQMLKTAYSQGRVDATRDMRNLLTYENT